MFVSLRFTLMQSLCCVHANEVSNTASWQRRGRKKGSPTRFYNSHSESNVIMLPRLRVWSLTLLQCNTLNPYRGQQERKWLYRFSSSEINEHCYSSHLSREISKWEHGQRRGGAEEGLWRSAYLCRNGVPNCGIWQVMDHNMKDVKQRASSAALLTHAQQKVSAREGTWEWYR